MKHNFYLARVYNDILMAEIEPTYLFQCVNCENAFQVLRRIYWDGSLADVSVGGLFMMCGGGSCDG